MVRVTGIMDMLPAGKDKQFVQAVCDRNFDFVKTALETGANVNGSPEQSLPPIAAATMLGNVGMVDFLLGQGANPDKPVCIDGFSCIPGERTLHMAARGGKVEIVRLLLNRSRADPNATDNAGRTPLMSTCSTVLIFVEVVRLLLEAGADPTLAAKDGQIPLHMVAVNGHTNLFDMLYTPAPATLNCCGANGQTPLFWACGKGHESIVSKLLSLGAMQPLDGHAMCPLQAAIAADFVGVVRVLLNEGGIRAVGGSMPLGRALFLAVTQRRARILRVLLTADGEEERSDWANIIVGDRPLLHSCASYCYPAGLSVLLEAGADEAARHSGRIPRDVIGMDLGRDAESQMDRGKETAIRRMLQRGPAYRARSWAWPADEEADAGGSGDGGTAAATAAAAAAAVLSSSPTVPKAPVIGVRIFRPKKESSSKFFVRLVGRYCAKN
ncbi:unnamed protein product [Laminaria digitata]